MYHDQFLNVYISKVFFKVVCPKKIAQVKFSNVYFSKVFYLPNSICQKWAGNPSALQQQTLLNTLTSGPGRPYIHPKYTHHAKHTYCPNYTHHAKHTNCPNTLTMQNTPLCKHTKCPKYANSAK